MTAGCCGTPRASGSCSTTCRTCSARSTRRPRKRPTAGTPTRTTTGARRSCCPGTRSRGRSTPRSRQGRGTPHGGIYLDIASRRSARVHPVPAAVHAPPVQGAGGRGHHQGADGDRADLPLRDGRGRGRPGHGRVLGARPVRGGRGVRRHARVQPARRQLAVRPAGVRQAGRRRRGRLPGVAGFG